MDATATLNYVNATALALRLPLTPERAHRVAVHLARTFALLEPLDALPLAVELEPAELYCPAPFPAADPS